METRPRGVSDRPKHIFYSPQDDGTALVSGPEYYTFRCVEVTYYLKKKVCFPIRSW